MANKRMFTMHIVDSDAFLDMPLSTQALYFHLNMRADDDGFLGNPKRIQRLIGASDDDLKILIAKRFVLAFEDGVIVIKHWRMHNTIQKDRYTPTAYQEELSTLLLKGNKSYSLNAGNKLETNWKQNVSPDIDIDIDKVIDKVIDSTSVEVNAGKPAKSTKHKYGEYKNVLLTDEELSKLKERFSDYEIRIDRLSEYIASKGTKYKSHYATILSWARREKESNKEKKPATNKFHNFEQRHTDYNKLVANYYGFNTGGST